MPYTYDDAGENAPHEIKEAIIRYHAMPAAEKQNRPLLYWLLGSGTPPYKMSKADSFYVSETDRSQTCGNCEFLYFKPARDIYICSQIRGRVKKSGWCKLWMPVKSA